MTSDAVYFYASGLLNSSDWESCQEGQMDIVVECGPGPTLQFPSAFGKDMPRDTLASLPHNTCRRSQSTVQPVSPISAKGPEELWNPTVRSCKPRYLCMTLIVSLSSFPEFQIIPCGPIG